MGGIFSISNDWNELLVTLFGKYKDCKCMKHDASDAEWSVWSGQFNRHCNSLETSTDYGPTSRIFQIWATLNRLLSLHNLLANTKQAHGKDGREAIKKNIDKNIKLLKHQKMAFMGVDND